MPPQTQYSRFQQQAASNIDSLSINFPQQAISQDKWTISEKPETKCCRHKMLKTQNAEDVIYKCLEKLNGGNKT